MTAKKLASDPRQDRAIEDPADDTLDREPFVGSLARALVRSELDGQGHLRSRQATGFVIGLTGPWGSGKSSILNLLYEQLHKTEDVAVVKINPWLLKDGDTLLSVYFDSLKHVMGKSSNERIRAIADYIYKYQRAVDWLGRTSAAMIDVHGGAGKAIKVWSFVSRLLPLLGKRPSRSPEDERKSLEAKIKSSRIAVVVLIDELDRIEDAEVRAVAQLIKAIGDIQGISYLVAYDPRRVADALGRGTELNERIESVTKYIEKIVQFPVPVRPLSSDEVQTLLSISLRHFGCMLQPPIQKRQEMMISCLNHAISTPRDVKRLAGAFSVLEEAVRGEVCSYDLLGYCWLLIKAPYVRDKIASHEQRIVSDPGEAELIARATSFVSQGSSPLTVADIFGLAAEEHRDLLGLMFPRFDSDPDTEWDQIARRRNLLRVLYVGNPPGMFRRRDIEEVWSLTNLSTIKTRLREFQGAGTLPNFLDRLEDLLPALPENGDSSFWNALSDIFVRDSDWVKGVENTRNLAEDAATSLVRLGMRKVEYVPRVKGVIHALIEASDLILVPWILRKHLFEHGLTVHGAARDRESILNKVETSNLLKLESPRYRRAIEAGIALRRIPNAEAIFVLYNTKQWDDSLRTNLTNQIDGAAAFSTLATLLTPPNVLIERSTLNDLIDVETVGPRVEAILTSGFVPDDPWVRASLSRLTAIIQGRDPHRI